MNRVEVDLIGDDVNAAVIRLPGRRFPGLVLQGDSLSVLLSLATSAIEGLQTGNRETPGEELVELRSLLKQYQIVYEKTMDVAGLELPYAKRDAYPDDPDFRIWQPTRLIL